MIDLITGANRDLYSEQLEEMWRQRYEVFVEKLGWDLPSQGGREKDRFDRDDTAYLVAREDDGSMIGSQRLLPTTSPYLLSEVFAELCDGDLPCSNSIWEVSRAYMLPCERGKKTRSQIAAELVCSSIEFALLHDIEQLVFEFDIEFLPQFLSNQWDVVPLGLPKDVGGQIMVAQAAKISPTTLSNVRRQYGIEGPLVRYKTHANAA